MREGCMLAPRSKRHSRVRQPPPLPPPRRTLCRRRWNEARARAFGLAGAAYADPAGQRAQAPYNHHMKHRACGQTWDGSEIDAEIDVAAGPDRTWHDAWSQSRWLLHLMLIPHIHIRTSTMDVYRQRMIYRTVQYSMILHSTFLQCHYFVLLLATCITALR